MSKKDKLFGEFVELRKKGESFQSIATQLEVSKQTLINWSKEEVINEEIEIERITRIQNHIHSLNQHHEAKIQFYSAFGNRLQEELEERDLSKVSTDKLISLLMRVDRKLDDLTTVVTFSDKEPFADAFKVASFVFDPKH